MASTESLKQQTKRGLYWKFAEQFAMYGIQFSIGIFMARMLSPEDYGITALPAVFMSVAGIFASGGFGSALIRKPDMKEEDLSTAFFYNLGMGVICYIALFCASPWIADFYNVPVLKPLMRITALSFLYGPIGMAQGIIMQRRLDFKTPAKISVVTGLLGGAIGISMAFMGYGLWSLVISGLISGIVGLCITISIVRWYPKTGWSRESFKYLWDYGNKMMGSWLVSTLYENISPVIIGKFFSPAQLGIYNRAAGYASLPSKNVTNTLRSVSFPVLSKIQSDEEKLALTYRRMLRLSAFVVFPLMMGLAAVARPVIIVMISAKWESCIILLQIMCFSMMWYPIHAINLNLLEVTGRSNLFFRLEIIKRIMGLAILCCTLPFGLVAYCWGDVLGSILALFANTYYTGKLIHMGFVQQMKDLLHILLLSFAMFAIVRLSITFIDSLPLQIIVGIPVGVAVYAGGAYLFRFKELNDFIYMISKKKK